MQRVLITRRIPPPAEELLTGRGLRVQALPSDEPAMRDALLAAAAGCAGIIATLTDRLDADLLAAAGPQLRVVANFAVGHDNIDLAACRARGVVATNTPDVLTSATADLTWALLLAAARRIGEGTALVRAGQWTGWTPMQLLGLELEGATLGIVGAGRIGTAVARRGLAFGMNVVYSHPRPNPDFERATGARRVELGELIEQADVVSLHAPMKPANRHMLGRAEFARMKPGSILVNTARGALLDEAALVEALRGGRPAAAGLDVYEHEPALAAGLAELPNAILLPHLGSATTRARQRMSRMAADNVLAVLEGRTAPNAIAG